MPEPEWRFEKTLIPYEKAVQAMEERVERMAHHHAPELIWFLEHPPLYTIGTSGHSQDILSNPHSLPIYQTGRGGQVTYHGPGQRVGYVMLQLKKRQLSPRTFTHQLEHWIQAVLKQLGIESFTDPKRIGLWVRQKEGVHSYERKIAALGVRIRHGISFHGFSLNVSCDLQAFQHIVPCGLTQFQATSLAALGGATPSLEEIDHLFHKTFSHFFENETFHRSQTILQIRTK